jgi:hypothetical protein
VKVEEEAVGFVGGDGVANDGEGRLTMRKWSLHLAPVCGDDQTESARRNPWVDYAGCGSKKRVHHDQVQMVWGDC